MLPLLALLIPTARAADWTDLPWMTADPPSLLAAASSAAPVKDAEAHVLLDETDVQIDADGRRVRRQRYVFVVLTPEGADDWCVFGSNWAGWYEDRPDIDARVITPDGVVHPLDKAHIAEAADAGSDPLVLSDVRVVRAPLPALVPGSVVEETITTREHDAFLAEGGVTYLPLAASGAVERTKISVEAYDSVTLNWRIESSDVKPVEARSKGLRTLSIDLGPRAFTRYFEPGIPSDVRPPALYVSTARSWSALAGAYSTIVDGVLAGSDLSSMAATARGGATDRRAIIAGLLAEVRKTRYIGIEFGQSAIVPSSPADVAKHGYGDCKDKATLLVGLLRASGIPAEVALVRTGPGKDVGPVPGLDEFNHAIVHVDGPDELWIDPTSDWTPVGDLPQGDQGRLALIAAQGTKALTPIPVLPSSANTATIVRDMTLSTRGDGRVVETRTTTGWLAQKARGAYAGADADDVHKYFAGQAKGHYLADAFDPPVLADPRDLATPFATTLTMPKAGAAFTTDDDATARFAWWVAFDGLPDWVKTDPDPGDEPRRNDLQLAAYHADVIEHVHPPAAYVPAALPDAVTDGVGPVAWTASYTADPDGTINAHLTFDTGAGRLTPDEVATLRGKLAAIGRGDITLLRWNHSGAAAFQAGKVGEALGISHKLADASPNDAILADEWAQALIKVGFGQAARDQAARASALAPDDAEITGRLGLVRMYDLTGGWLGVGFDRTGAQTALQRAIAIDPKDNRFYVWLATVDQTGDDGKLLTDGSDIDGAIAALQGLRTVAGVHDKDEALATYYAHAERWDDLDALVKELEAGPTRRAYQVELAAIRGGGDAGIAEAARVGTTPDERRAAMETAGNNLALHRRYADAGKLIDASATGSPNAVALRTRARIYATTVPYDKVKLAKDDPAVITARLAVAAMGSDQDLMALFSPEMTMDSSDEAAHDAAVAIRTAMKASLPIAVVADLAIANSDPKVDGDAATGWRVRADLKTGGAGKVVFVVKTKGECHIRAFADHIPDLGVEAVARVDRGDLVGARQWLDWARDVDDAPAGADPFDASPFAHTWQRAADADAHAIRAAAAVLMAGGPERSEAAIPVLVAERAASSDPAASLQIDRALFEAYQHTARWDDARVVAERMRTDRPDAAAAMSDWAVAMGALGRIAEVRPVVDTAIAAHPADVKWLRVGADVAVAAYDLPSAGAAWQRVVDTGRGTAGDYNNLAWFDLAEPSRAIPAAEQSNAMGAWKSQGALHTLATALLDAGRPDEALEVLTQAWTDPNARIGGQVQAWQYVRGRLAEAWGLPDVALAFYQDIPAPAAGVPPGPWTIERMTEDRRIALKAR